jgi:hypothetical protein
MKLEKAQAKPAPCGESAVGFEGGEGKSDEQQQKH